MTAISNKTNNPINMEELIHLDINLRTKIHLCAFLCVFKSTHPHILNDSSVVAHLSITCAALFCRRCKLLLHAIDSPSHVVSV